jgi:solute carrier family 35 protein E2
MKNVFRDMIYIGAFRCVTIILGLIALKYIAVSFVATIKSSSPLFTVLISRIILKERTSKKFFFQRFISKILFQLVGQNFL